MGTVNVEFDSDFTAKKVQTAMTGFRIEDSVLEARRLEGPETAQTGGEGEYFRSIIEDKPTTCLEVKHVVSLAEIESRIDYKELEFDVEDEMMRYGRCIKVVVPRPPLFGNPYDATGFGKVYIRFREVEEAKRARDALFKRRFNGRAVETAYYAEDKFVKGVWQ